jgi:hypothetical protein
MRYVKVMAELLQRPGKRLPMTLGHIIEARQWDVPLASRGL